MPATTTAPLGRGFAFLLIGQFVTTVGNQVQDVATMLWLKDLTGSAALMGTALLLTNLPEAVLAPLGGRIADRAGRRRTMIVADLLAAAAIALAVALAWSGAGAAAMVAALCAGNLIVGITSAASGPASSALIPDLVAEDRLGRANAAHQTAGTTARLLGQGLAGLLYGTLGAVWALAINAVSFAASAASALPIREPARAPVPAEGNLLMETIRGVIRVVRRPDLRRLLAFILVFHLCLSVLPVTLPFHAERALGLASSWTGFLIAAYSGGILLGFALAGTLRVEKGLGPVAAGGLAVGLLFAVLAFAPTVWAAVPALIGIGAGIGFIIVNVITALQAAAGAEERGVTMGAAQAVGGTTLPVGMALTGVLIDAAGAAGLPPLAVTGGILSLAGLAAALLALTALARLRCPAKSHPAAVRAE
jgi:MFS transporter, DHA3 family, macrolide efflux protein